MDPNELAYLYKHYDWNEPKCKLIAENLVTGPCEDSGHNYLQGRAHRCPVIYIIFFLQTQELDFSFFNNKEEAMWQYLQGDFIDMLTRDIILCLCHSRFDKPFAKLLLLALGSCEEHKNTDLFGQYTMFFITADRLHEKVVCLI